MLLFAAGLIAAAATPATPGSPKANPSEKCPRSTSYYAWQNGKTVKPKKLTELPPANAYIAIVRNDGACDVPVIVKFNMGGR